MNEDISKIINQAALTIVNKSNTDDKIESLSSKHDTKVHFIPQSYRILGGLLQSMNIQFGNFLEVFMTLLIKYDGRYEILKKYSGIKKRKSSLSVSNDERIDKFITMCNKNNSINLEVEFPKLLREICSDNNTSLIDIEHDIDILFKSKSTGVIYYVEVKYNDDHDTGKFIDINRKFIKTYAYLAREFRNEEIKPILFYFVNNKSIKKNSFVPENTNIMRGEKFFEEFLSIKYEDVNKCLHDFSEKPETKKAFDDLYKKVMFHSRN